MCLRGQARRLQHNKVWAENNRHYRHAIHYKVVNNRLYTCYRKTLSLWAAQFALQLLCGFCASAFMPLTSSWIHPLGVTKQHCRGSENKMRASFSRLAGQFSKLSYHHWFYFYNWRHRLNMYQHLCLKRLHFIILPIEGSARLFDEIFDQIM